MRAASLFLLVVIAIFYGCKKDSSYMAQATIIGIDTRMAPCTGGTFISIDDHPNVHHILGYYDIGALPASFQVHVNQRVLIDWNISSNCFGNYVDITRIKEIN
jgi:hypothetical protein